MCLFFSCAVSAVFPAAATLGPDGGVLTFAGLLKALDGVFGVLGDCDVLLVLVVAFDVDPLLDGTLGWLCVELCIGFVLALVGGLAAFDGALALVFAVLLALGEMPE